MHVVKKRPQEKDGEYYHSSCYKFQSLMITSLWQVSVKIMTCRKFIRVINLDSLVLEFTGSQSS